MIAFIIKLKISLYTVFSLTIDKIDIDYRVLYYILNIRKYTIIKLAKYTIHTRKIKFFNRYTKIHTRINNLLIHEYTIHDF